MKSSTLRIPHAQLCFAAIIINAYSGAFQEVGFFDSNGIEYLTKDKVLGIARNYYDEYYLDYERFVTNELYIPNRMLDARFSQSTGYKTDQFIATAQLIFVHAHQVDSRFMPVWKIVIEGESEPLYVTQDGHVLERLSRWPLGD